MTQSSELSFASAGTLVSLLAARKVSAVELCDLAIQRIEAVDRPINAVVVRDFERAREAAKAADARRVRGERAPLLGVPMTVKEAYNVAGPADHLGLPDGQGISADRRRPRDLRGSKRPAPSSSARPTCRLSLADWQSYNDIYGDHQQSLGLDAHARRLVGRLGGVAGRGLRCARARLRYRRLVAHCRRTIAACSPTSRASVLVPARGHTPPGVPALPMESDLAVIGPMARSAADLALALDVIAGPDDAGQCHRLPTGVAAGEARGPEGLPRSRHRHASADPHRELGAGRARQAG